MIQSRDKPVWEIMPKIVWWYSDFMLIFSTEQLCVCVCARGYENSVCVGAAFTPAVKVFLRICSVCTGGGGELILQASWYFEEKH